MAKEKRPYGTPRIEIRNGYKYAECAWCKQWWNVSWQFSARNAAGNGKGAEKMIRCFLILTLAVMIKVAFDIHNHKVDVRAAEAGAKLERIPKGEEV